MRFKLPRLPFASYRPPQTQPSRAACNWMLVSAASAFALHAPRLPSWLTITALGLLVWRYLVENHGWRIPSRVLRWALLVVGAVIVYRQFGTLFGREGGVGFLALLIGLKIMEIKTQRDYLVTMFLLYMLVMTHFLHSQALGSALYAVAVVLIATHALLLLNRVGSADTGRSLRLVGVMFLQALPLLLLLYFLFPRIQGAFWQTPLNADSGQTGISEQVSPGSINQLYNNDSVAFRAEFRGRIPDPGELYWRVFVLNDSDGRTWRRTRGYANAVDGEYLRQQAGSLRYTVTLEPHRQSWLPALELPAWSGPDASVDRDFTATAHRKVKVRRSFDLASYLRYTMTGLSPRGHERNTRWPTSPSERVAGLVATWKRQSNSPAELVQRALQHFRTEPFRYTLTPPLLGADPVDEFMFDTQAGFCEHYASAFAALMRLAGIPTRLVAGYQGGEWNAVGQYLMVRQSDAHAWTEVWLPDSGWTRVDPTVAVAPERIELGAFAIRELSALGAGFGALDLAEARRLVAPDWVQSLWRGVRQRWDAANNTWNKRVTGFDLNAQRRMLRLLGFATPDWVTTVAMLSISLLVSMLVLAAIILYKRRPHDPVVQYYRKFRRKLTRVGIDHRDHEGPLDFAKRICAARPDLVAGVRAITEGYIALRYRKYDENRMTSFKQQVTEFDPRAQKPS